MHALRRSLTAGLLALAVVLVLVPPQLAGASPLSQKRERLRQVQAQLERAGARVERAAEDYDQATARLSAVRSRIRENDGALKIARLNLAIAKRQLATRAKDIYKTPQTGIVDVVLASRSFEDLVTQLNVMQRLGDNDAALVASVSAYAQQIRDKRIELRADEKTAVGLVAQQRVKKATAEALEARMQRLERGLKADLRRAVAQEAARQAAAVAARQAAAATAAAAAAPSATGVAASQSSSGTVVADPGGPGHPEVVAIAQRYLGIPYLWGGASPRTGFDCSGLVMYVYAQVGIRLAHGATYQQRASKPVALNALAPGDLVFYGNASYSYHVAIYVGGGRTIEAARTGTNVRYGYVGSAWIGGRF